VLRVGVEVPRSHEFSARFDAVVNACFSTVPGGEVARIDPEAFDRPALTGVTIERASALGGELGELVENPGQFGQGCAHRSSVSTCAAGASSVMTFTQTPMVLAAASA
jgi:hypothetical protein